MPHNGPYGETGQANCRHHWQPMAERAESRSSNRGRSKQCIHTIPVPRGWSIEQAFEAIYRGDTLTDPEPMWANVFVDEQGKMLHVVRDEDKYG